MSQNLFNRVWDLHTVRELPSGQTQLFIGLHLIHEVTSPQAFGMLKELGLPVLHPERTFATVDHIVPTDSLLRPFQDAVAEEMTQSLERSTSSLGITFYGVGSEHRGIVHTIGPELGLTQPGMTIACGDSHTSTHGAFGNIALGIGTSQIRDVLATQCLAIARPKVRRITVDGRLANGVYAKDLTLHLIRQLGVKGGVGYAYEHSGEAVEALDMEGRMTVCNMSIEGGARVGYINPDQTTVEYLRGREHVPQGEAFERAAAWWTSLASGPDADYDDEVTINAADIEPVVTYGINPGQSVSVGERIPDPARLGDQERASVEEALAYMQLSPNAAIAGTPIDVAFIGSCTNGRTSDFREAARVVRGRRVAAGVKALAVPGSMLVKQECEAEGLDQVFRDAGFEWREPGCSMCLAMNPDKLVGDQLCASTSNRNFKGRQGSPTGRTLLMSPAMVAAAACEGAVTDVRELLPSGVEAS